VLNKTNWLVLAAGTLVVAILLRARLRLAGSQCGDDLVEKAMPLRDRDVCMNCF
jgi:hypothetical protein